MKLMNTFAGSYPAFRRCGEEVAGEIRRACAVLEPGSWKKGCQRTLDRLVAERKLAEWRALEINLSARSISFECRPSFVPLAASTILSISLVVGVL